VPKYTGMGARAFSAAVLAVVAAGTVLLLVLAPRPDGYACVRVHLGPPVCGTRAYP